MRTIFIQNIFQDFNTKNPPDKNNKNLEKECSVINWLNFQPSYNGRSPLIRIF
jgi:hypothetical protein